MKVGQTALRLSRRTANCDDALIHVWGGVMLEYISAIPALSVAPACSRHSRLRGNVG